MVTAQRIESAVVEKLYELIANEDWQHRPDAFPQSRADWDGLERDQQHVFLEQAVNRILYDHSREQAGIQLSHSGHGHAGEEIFVRVRKKAWEHLSPPPAKGEAQIKLRESRLPRLSRLMALATRLEGLLQDGTVKDYADLARLGGVSRARITQIMNLRNLAPAIQEQLLFLSAEGGKKVNEAMLRRIANETDWRRQMEIFDGVRSPLTSGRSGRSAGAGPACKSCGPGHQGSESTRDSQGRQRTTSAAPR